MNFELFTQTPERCSADCLVVALFESGILSHSAQALDHLSAGYIANIVNMGDIQGKLGQHLLLPQVPNIPSKRVLLIGCGPVDGLNGVQFRTLMATTMGLLKDTAAQSACLYLTEVNTLKGDEAWKIKQMILTMEHSLYRFEQLKTLKNNSTLHLLNILIYIEEDSNNALCQQNLDIAKAMASGVRMARDLGNLPGNICTPHYLAQQARDIAATNPKFHIDILEQEDMESLKMGSLLSVAKGSLQPPKFIVLHYNGAHNHLSPVVLVGKGITFDAGGISLKPPQDMDQMKFDMCGAAAVLGTMVAVASLNLALNVIAVIPAAENLPSGCANKPGDIVTSMSGQTIEILNTDAEGRLILCDALTFVERFKPQAVIDVATLTGSCVIALGRHPSGLFSNNDPLLQALIQAGTTSADPVWPMPLWDEYQDQLKSNFADMANIGGKEGGLITAACFLSRFTHEYAWAHLDIAGTAWYTGDRKGASGRPVSLLTQYLVDLSLNNTHKPLD